MKKFLLAIIMCVVFTASLTNASAEGSYFDAGQGFAIEVNGEATEYTSVILSDTHYVPMRKVFEIMGAHVFYKSSGQQVLALSRDGDIIHHVIGDDTITVNGSRKSFETVSVVSNYETYIPMEMISAAFCPDGISYDNGRLNIQKQFLTSDYHRTIKEVLDVCRSSNFYPERFQRYINYHVKNPQFSMQDVIFKVNLGLDYPFYENVAEIENPHELLVLVNKYNKLPAGFSQYNLVNMQKEYTVNDGKQYLLSAVAYDKYVKMADAAKKEGLTMKVVSAYRTENYQKNLYDDKVKATGKTNADNYSARPGHSEHQTGLAVDINSTSGAFENSLEFKWLQKHAHEYGYILRYPQGKEWITGYAYEPWHYRYVGVEAASIIYAEKITYEQYYAKYISVNEYR